MARKRDRKQTAPPTEPRTVQVLPPPRSSDGINHPDDDRDDDPEAAEHIEALDTTENQALLGEYFEEYPQLAVEDAIALADNNVAIEFYAEARGTLKVMDVIAAYLANMTVHQYRRGKHAGMTKQEIISSWLHGESHYDQMVKVRAHVPDHDQARVYIERGINHLEARQLIELGIGAGSDFVRYCAIRFDAGEGHDEAVHATLTLAEFDETTRFLRQNVNLGHPSSRVIEEAVMELDGYTPQALGSTCPSNHYRHHIADGLSPRAALARVMVDWS